VRKIWNLTISGQAHQVDVTWDVSATGCGSITVDGVELQRWSLGAKLPGLTKELQVASRPAHVQQRILDFDLYVDGQLVPGGQVAPFQRPASAILITAALAVAVLLVAGLVALAVVLAMR